jgi:hypothetical protein
VKFEPTRKEFDLVDEGGYSFHVVLARDSEGGWDAHVSLGSHGYRTEEGAIRKLQTCVEKLQAMLKEVEL